MTAKEIDDELLEHIFKIIEGKNFDVLTLRMVKNDLNSLYNK